MMTKVALSKKKDYSPILMKVCVCLYNDKTNAKFDDVPLKSCLLIGVYPQLESGLELRVGNRKIFPYFSTKTYVVGTQKNSLNATVLLSTQNIC